MSKQEELKRNTEKAYNEAVEALINLVNAITEERDYYKSLIEKKEPPSFDDESWHSSTEPVMRREIGL